jgi:hypothetical protein
MSGASSVVVVKPGEGEQTGPPAFRVAFKLWASDCSLRASIPASHVSALGSSPSTVIPRTQTTRA